MELHLRDRVVIVTGGSRGIGRAAVLALLAEGAHVATCGRNAASLTSLTEAAAAGARLLTIPCDVTSPCETERFVAAVHERFGRVDAVVANAGHGASGTVLETPWDVWQEQFAVKTGSVLHLVRPCVPLLRESESPRIVVVNGVTAHAPESGMAAVGVARAAVANLTRLLARDLARDGICVNAVNLGPFVTDRQRARHAESGAGSDFDEWCAGQALARGVPLGRMGTPDEVVPWILLLCSPLSSFTTGASIDVSGGLGIA